MKIVNSYDLFDTILGRKINNRIEFFNNCMKNNFLNDFISVRIIAEEKAKDENPYYNLLNIYKHIQNHYKLNYSKTIQVLNLELALEIHNIYPIYFNVNKLDSDSIIIVDSYYTSEQIKQFMSKFNIIDIPIYTSNEVAALKSNGTMYTYLKKLYKIKNHTGSDLISDYENPINSKIKATHYEYKYNQMILYLNNKISSHTKNFLKMIECLCKDQETEHIWNVQLYNNIPLLILFANILKEFCKEKNIQEIIFVNRSAILIKNIFEKINQFKPVNVKVSELTVSYKLFNNKKYLKHILNDYNDITKYLIVDIHDGFIHIINDFFKTSYNLDPYYYSIFSSKEMSKLMSTDKYNYSLYSDEPDISRLVELFNLIDIGYPNDFVNNIIKFSKFEYKNLIPTIFNDLINEVIKNLDNEVINDLNQNILVEILDNFKQLKTKIDNNIEYQDLCDIYKTSKKYYLKKDYVIEITREQIINRIVNPTLKEIFIKELKKEIEEDNEKNEIKKIDGTLNQSLVNIIRKETVVIPKEEPKVDMETLIDKGPSSLNPSLVNRLRKQSVKQEKPENKDDLLNDLISDPLNESIKPYLKKKNSKRL
jgi:hypothetical protein